MHHRSDGGNEQHLCPEGQARAPGGADRPFMSPSFVTLTVPPGTLPGQTVQFEDPATKATMQVAVPAGAAPGSTFQVQVASGTESSQSEIEAALRTAQASAAVAAVLIKGAARASIIVGKAAFKGAKYVHEKGWDRKAASAAGTTVSAVGTGVGKMSVAEKAASAANSGVGKMALAGAGLAMGASLYDVSMDAAFDKHSAPTSGRPTAPAPAPAAAASGAAPLGSTMWVVVPPNAGPGAQIVVLTPSGQQCTVEVPVGATAGTQFPVQLPRG